MTKFIFIAGLLLVLAGYFSCRQKTPVQAPEKTIANTLVAQVDSFAIACDHLGAAIERGNEKECQDLFLAARLAYKRFEWAAEYFEPATSRFVNGPPVPEVEASSHAVFAPAGLQVMEGY